MSTPRDCLSRVVYFDLRFENDTDGIFGVTVSHMGAGHDTTHEPPLNDEEIKALQKRLLDWLENNAAEVLDDIAAKFVANCNREYESGVRATINGRMKRPSLTLVE